MIKSALHEDLLAAIYPELRQIAARLMQAERKNHTLQKTALVHEAISQLLQSDLGQIESDRHLLAVTVRKMRHVLVDHARRGKSDKRGGGWERLTELHLDVIPSKSGLAINDWILLSDALEKLGLRDPRALQVVELKFFGGFTNSEAAHILGVSDGSVEAVWLHARLWLTRELSLRAPNGGTPSPA